MQDAENDIYARAFSFWLAFIKKLKFSFLEMHFLYKK